MSAPAMNALSPAPVRITPRTPASSGAASKAARRSSHVFPFSALRTLGRLSVTYAMAPFFSNKTFSSVGAAVGVDAAAAGGVTVAIELINSVETFVDNLCLLTESHKGAEPGDSFAEDQILDLVSAFVGEQRFRVGKIARDVVLGGDAVASEYLPRPRDGFATLCRGEGLGEGSL